MPPATDAPPPSLPSTWGRRYPPAPWFATKDGVRLHTRTIRADDAPRLLDLFERLSPEVRRQRFHGDADRLTQEAKRRGAAYFAAVDNRTRGGAIVAVDRRGCADGGDEEIVGIVQLGRNAALDDPEAEVAIVVRDDFQGRGVGRALLQRIGPLARQMGVRTMLAAIDVENRPALLLFRSLGLPTTAITRQGVTLLRITLPDGDGPTAA
jgi:GNAT superfamily N-acetyltransferase